MLRFSSRMKLDLPSRLAMPARKVDHMAEANSKRAIIAGIVMIAIYAVQFVAARFSLRDHLTPSDLAILRFTAAGAAFLPIMMRAGFSGAKALGLRKATALALLAGLPYPLVINWGLTHAPAAHAAALCPASIIFFSFLLSRVVFGDRISSDRAIGIAAIIAGLLLLIAPTGGIVADTALGDVLFVGSGLMFAAYAVLVRRWSVDPVLATASVALLSCVPIPLLFAVAPSGFATAPGSEIVAQFVIQGFVAGAGATFLYTYIVRQLGPQAASLFLPFVPITASLLGAIALAEIPGPWQILAILIMAAGMAYPAISDRKVANAPT
jgi:drug/metabolite transporter (DMT)-like permease